MKLNQAILQAIRKAQTWMGGAVVVATDDGYDVCPGAFLNDISYRGYETSHS